MDTKGGRRGRPPHPDILTPAEWNVLRELRKGLTNAEIAVELGISPDGVKYHVSNMLAKLVLADRHELAKWKPPRAEALGRIPLRAGLIGLAGIGGVAAATVAIVVGLALLRGSSSPGDGLPDIRSTLHIASFRLTQKLVFDAHTPLPSGGFLPLPPGGSTGTITVYFRGPDTFRDEQVSTIAGNGDSGTQTDTSVSLWNADSNWSWTPGSAIVRKVTTSGAAAKEANAAYPQQGTSMRSLVAELAPGQAAHLSGEGVVAGRPAYIIDIGPRPCATNTPDLDGNRRVWLDKQTLFLLKSEQYSRTGGRLTASTEVTAIEYNGNLDDSLFAPPKDMTVEDINPSGSCGTAIADPTSTIGHKMIVGLSQCGSAVRFTSGDDAHGCPSPIPTSKETPVRGPS